jgi:predicted RNA-binding Zn-ribbon protein involved in translation (DUF1610 family)
MVDWISLGIQALSIVLSVAAILLVFVFMHKLAVKREKNRLDMYVCPTCGGTNIVHEKKGPKDTFFVGSLKSSNFFVCHDCKYEGACLLILKTELEDFRKDLKKKS